MNDMWACFIVYTISAILSGFGLYKVKDMRKFFTFLFIFWGVMAIVMGLGIYYG